MRSLLTFFLRNGIHSRRTLWMAVLGFFPVGAAVLNWMAGSFLQGEGISLFGLFPQLGLLLFINLLIPLTTIFIGSAVIADEVEEGTLPYLLVRPVWRGWIVLAKLMAGAVTLAVILSTSLLLTYTVLVSRGESGGWVANISILLKAEWVLLLAVVAYLPLFALVGGLVKRPVLLGLLFAFGWEPMVAFLPGNIKLMTVVHYLHEIFPAVADSSGGDMRSMIFGSVLPAREISDLSAVLILLGIAVVFSVFSMALLSIREYRLEPGD